MSELSECNPLGRFSGLADKYARCRPSYPAAAIDYVYARCNLEAGKLLVDVGCGTGISSRLFSQKGLQVIGLEPNQDMLTQAMAESGSCPAEYRCASAEETGLS